jgi:LemA protein
MPTIMWVILIVAAVVVFWLVAVYNGLITMKNQVDEAWSDIDVQTKRRYDLIPNIVETVKGYASHEAGVFEAVTKARSVAMGAQDPTSKGVAENGLSGALKSLFAVAENYPELKANQNFLGLQQTLTDIEEKIQAARRFYNGSVRDFNTKLQVFPTNMVGNMLGFKDRVFFAAEEEAKQNVQVKF